MAQVGGGDEIDEAPLSPLPQIENRGKSPQSKGTGVKNCRMESIRNRVGGGGALGQGDGRKVSRASEGASWVPVVVVLAFLVQLRLPSPQMQHFIKSPKMPERTGIVTRAGHICMICSFIPTTKNKYRELQDHLVRKHFNDRIKAVMPIRRPYMCPEPNCSIEGKDWQALMRHYTGKHGVLEAFLKEVIDSGHTLPPNPKHAKKNLNKNKTAQAQQQQQPPQQPHQQQHMLLQQPPIEALSPIQSTLLPDCNARRTRKLSHNSTGSASSPESLQEEEDPQQQQPQQLALIVKRRRPNGEETIALIDLNCFLASSTYIPYPEPQLLAAAAGKNTHFNVLSADFFGEDVKEEMHTTQQQELIQQQLGQQQPTLFAAAHDQAQQVQQQLLQDQQSQAQQEHEQQLKEIEQHLQLDQQQQQQQQQLDLQTSAEEQQQLVDESDESQQLLHFQTTSEIIELSDEQFGDQTMVPIFVTPSGELIQLPYLNSFQFQDGEPAFQIIQTVPANRAAGGGVSSSLAMVQGSQHQIFHVQQQQSVNAIDDHFLRPIEVVNNDRVIVEEVPVFTTIDNSAMVAIEDSPKVDSSANPGAKEQELAFGMY